MADTSRGQTPTAIERAIEELGSSLNANRKNECTGRLKLIISDLKNKYLRTNSAADEFVDHGGLRELVSVTKMCGRIKDSILGTAIGCLANICSLSRKARAKITVEDLEWFGTMLQNTTSPKLFNCIARLIANVAKDPENVMALQESLVVPEIAKGFSSCNDVDCKLSIIRALCILAKYKDLRKAIHNHEGFSALLECLKSEDAKVSVGAIFAIEVFIASKEPEYSSELCTVGGLVAIVKLMVELTTKCIKPALNIISMCANKPDCRGDVGTSGAVESLIQMSSDPQLGKFLPKIILILCSMCNDVIGRQKMKDFGGLKILIAKLNDTEFLNLHTNVLSALRHYYFDEATLKFMVEKLELHKTLVNCLSREACGHENSASSDDKNEMSSSGEEASVDSLYSLMQSSPSTMSRSSTPASLQDVDDSSKDQLSSFPPDLSVVSYRVQDLPDTGTEGSDFCSESEKLAVSLLSSDLDHSLTSSSSSSSSRKRQSLHIDIINNTTHTPPNLVDSILSSPKAYRSPLIHSPISSYSFSDQVSLLLSRISLISQCQELLATADTLTTILKYICSVSPCNPYCLKIMNRVLKNPKCFEKAILAFIPSVIWRDMCIVPWPSKPATETNSETLQPITLEVEDRSTCEPTLFAFYLKRLVSLVNTVSRNDPGCPTNMSSFANTLQYMGAELLSVLCKVAESPFGTGVLSSMLLRGGCREKEACVSAVPFVCHSLQIVRKLMLDYGGLDNLVELVSSSDEEAVQQTAILSLVFLLQSIKCQSSLRVDKQAKTKQHQEPDKEALLSECQYKPDPKWPYDVEILVYPSGVKTNGHYKFSAHKEVLSKISDVFGAMLGGSFAESKSRKVVLKGVCPRAFLAILHHLYGCSLNCAQVGEELNSFLNNSEEENTNCRSNDAPSDITSNSLNPDNLISLIFTTKMSSAEETEQHFLEARQCLELLACANRFLLTDLCTACEEWLCQCLPLDSTNVHLPSLFTYCQIHEAKILPQLILDHVLLQLGNPSHCLKLFREILGGPAGYAALMLIKNSICNFIKR